MSFSQALTGGVIRFEDALKHDPTDQYSLSRRVAVELRFDVEYAEASDNEEAIVAHVGDLARAQCNRLLRQNGVATPVIPETTATDPAANPPATRKRRTQAEIAADKAAAEAKGDPADIGGDEPTPAAKALAEIAGTGADPAEVQQVIDAEEADPWDVGGDAPAATEITDADLTSATTKRNEELANPPLIRGLIQSFAPEGKQIKLTDISQADRPAYLAKLKALVKA